MVKISDAIDECCEILNGKTENARFEAYVLAQNVFDADRLRLRLRADDEADDRLYHKLISFAKRRAAGEPSAYITGHREFMSLDFIVNKSVLIPRPDTEILVEAVIERYCGERVRILDICTGSGAIACSLAYYIKEACILGIDISDGALEVAAANAEKLGVSGRVNLSRYDALKRLDCFGKFDAVVSNPPYIESAVLKTLSREVRDFEPSIALDGGKSGLVFYEKIVGNIDYCLKQGGRLYFEIGYNQAEAVKSIMSSKFEGISVLRDFAGNDRVVYGQLV